MTTTNPARKKVVSSISVKCLITVLKQNKLFKTCFVSNVWYSDKVHEHQNTNCKQQNEILNEPLCNKRLKVALRIFLLTRRGVSLKATWGVSLKLNKKHFKNSKLVWSINAKRHIHIKVGKKTHNFLLTKNSERTYLTSLLLWLIEFIYTINFFFNVLRVTKVKEVIVQIVTA